MRGKDCDRRRSTYICGEMGAVMICLDVAASVGGVDMKGVKVGTDRFYRREVLYLISIAAE